MQDRIEITNIRPGDYDRIYKAVERIVYANVDDMPELVFLENGDGEVIGNEFEFVPKK